MLANPQAGQPACRRMVCNYSEILVQLFVGCLATVSLVLVGFLGRLEIVDIRKKRRMAAKGGRFGLITQNVTATGTPICNSSSPMSKRAQSAFVPRVDRVAKSWTIPVKTPRVSFQWN